MKILLPLIAAILILGAIAIFGGMALNNHNDSKSDDQKIANQSKKDSDKKMVRNPKITKTKNLIVTKTKNLILIRTQMMTLIIVPQILTLLQLIITIM